MAAQAKTRKTTAQTAAARVETQKTSVNEVAGRVRTLWLGYLTLGTYLFIAVGSVTHRQLFLETPIRLPILNVDLPLIGFFAIAPLFFLVNHFYLLLTLLSLGRRIAEYNRALEMDKLAPAVENEIRRKLDSFVIVLALAGTEEERQGSTSYMLRIIAWLTVVCAPVILLLFTQLTFLPYHHWWVTWLHRGVLILDLSLLWVFWPAIREGDKGLPVAWPQEKPLSAAISSLLVIFSLFIATFPGERLDQNAFATVRWVPYWPSDEVITVDGKERRHPNGIALYKLLFLGDVDWVTGKRKSLWSNTLVLPDNEDLVGDRRFADFKNRSEEEGKKPWQGKRTIRLRGRDLRGAVLSRSDLHHADFTGAEMQGADLFRAQMQGADLRWAQMKGANLIEAQMKGANLIEAEMQGADLFRAQMQGADLRWAQMKGADLKAARMQGADLEWAQIWQLTPVISDQIKDADLRALSFSSFYPDAARRVLESLKQEAVRKREAERLAPMLDAGTVAVWAGSDAQQTWRHFSSASRSDPAAVAKILTGLACNDGTGGYIAKGIARRIFRPFEEGKKYMKLTAKALLDKKTCPAAKILSEETLAKLRKIARPEMKKPEPKAAQ